jgi:hypothetical protein
MLFRYGAVPAGRQKEILERIRRGTGPAGQAVTEVTARELIASLTNWKNR